MKTLRFILPILVIIGFSSCKDNNEDFFPQEIGLVISDLTASFDTLNTAMAASATTIAPYTSDTTLIRNEMNHLFTYSSFTENFAFIDEEGIIKMIEPTSYNSVVGSDISQQEHVIRAWETLQPVLSNVFYAVEGYYAASDLHPVLNNGNLRGAISALFEPSVILERIITPYVTDKAFEMWVMEKGGLVLFDQDADEIGRNVFTDPLYQDFPELISAAQLMDAEKSGATTYSFYQTGTTTEVVKKAYWDTYNLYGTEWKVIWVKPE